MDKIMLYVDKDFYIREEYEKAEEVVEIWVDDFFPPNSKYIMEILRKNNKIIFKRLFILTEDNYVSFLKEIPLVANAFNRECIITLSWFSKPPSLHRIEKLLYEALEKSKNIKTIGIPLCYLVDFYDRSIEYILIKKYGYERAIERLPWKFFKSEQCRHCIMNNYCVGVPESYKSYYYKIVKLANWEGIIDLYPIF